MTRRGEPQRHRLLPKPTPEPTPAPSPTPEPTPAPQITPAVASTRCLAEVGVSSVAALLGGKLTQHHACMARYGY